MDKTEVVTENAVEEVAVGNAPEEAVIKDEGQSVDAVVESKVENILGKTERETKQEYKDYVVGKFVKKMIYPLLEGGLSPEGIKSACDKVVSSCIGEVLTLPGYLPQIKKCFTPSQFSVGVVVGYPFAEEGLDILLKSIKSYAKSPVTEVISVLSVSDLKYNKAKKSEKILKTLCSVKKRKKLTVGVMLDTAKFAPGDLSAAIKKISSHDIDRIYLSTAIYKDSFSDVIFENVKTQIKGDIKVVASNFFTEDDELSKAVKDADYIVSDKAFEYIESIKNTINLQ